MDVYKKIDGSPVQLGNVLSRGGEGLVYEVAFFAVFGCEDLA